MKKHIPNFITCLNLLCGTLSIFFAFNGKLEIAGYLIFIAALFDFIDGFAARALKAYSDIGKELDSLADLISFGVAPAAILSNLILIMVVGDGHSTFFELGLSQQLMVLFPFTLAAFAALRLAKFNIDTRQTENFLGLTTTATGMFTASLVFLLNKEFAWLNTMVTPIFLIAMICVFCGLLVSEIPMFSLKFKNYQWQNNQQRFILLISSILLIATFGWAGISIVILTYVLFSISLLFICTKKKV